MQITKMGQIIVKNTTGHDMGWCCRFGKRWISINVAENGAVTFGDSVHGAPLSTINWVMHPDRRAMLREHLSDMLRAERQLKRMGI